MPAGVFYLAVCWLRGAFPTCFPLVEFSHKPTNRAQSKPHSAGELARRLQSVDRGLGQPCPGAHLGNPEKFLHVELHL